MTRPERSDCAKSFIVDWWRWREPSTRRKLLRPIGQDLERLIGTDWRLWGHRAQRPPGGAWSSWLFLGGRGAGKTRAGAEWLTERATPGARLALVGPTLHDVREVMIEGPSGLRAVAAPWRRPIYEAGRRRLMWPNGAVAHAFSAEDADSLRGPQFHAAWCDEFCAWRRPGEVLAMLRMGLRLGDDPRLVITTTPRPIAALKTLMAEPRTVTTRAATAVNRWNLSADFLQGLNALYGGTRLAEQELEGRLLSDDGGLWTEAMLNACRGRAPERFERVVVGLDPPATAANVLAVQTELGWELIGFRQAAALGDGVWRLSGLLRALQGTETEMRAGAEAGATVVMLDDALTRLDLRRDERGLPLLFRAGPAGAPPGGAETTSQTVSCPGVYDRPWSVVHLGLEATDGGTTIRWTPRRRLYGDGWDADRNLEAGLRFRLRFLDGAVVRRSLETEDLQAVYSEADQTIDFPGGLSTAAVEISPWGDAWGWGPATRLSMAV